MAQKVAKVGVKKTAGYLYFLDKKGNVCRVPMARAGKKRGKVEVLAKTNIKKQKGYLYFIDKQGDVSCAKMVRGRKKGTGKKKKKKR